MYMLVAKYAFSVVKQHAWVLNTRMRELSHAILFLFFLCDATFLIRMKNKKNIFCLFTFRYSLESFNQLYIKKSVKHVNYYMHVVVD